MQALYDVATSKRLAHLGHRLPHFRFRLKLEEKGYESDGPLDAGR